MMSFPYSIFLINKKITNGEEFAGNFFSLLGMLDIACVFT
jgi:hypothetical protein